MAIIQEDKDNEISNEENEKLEIPKIGGNFLDSGEKTSSETPANRDKAGKNSDSANTETSDLTPAEMARKKRDESEERKNNTKTKLYGVLIMCEKILTAILSIILIVLAVYWAYNLSSISEPIGGLKEKVSRFEQDINKIKQDIEDLEDNLSGTREEFIKKSK